MENSLEVLKFDLTPQQVKFRNILNKEFIEAEIYAISDADPNRNGTHFTLEAMQEAVDNNSFKNKPIVGFFEKNDFTTHEGRAAYDPEVDKTYWDTSNGERILGWIRESDKVEIVEKDGLHWIKFTCILCVTYCYAQVKRLLKDRKKKVSVEITVTKYGERDDGVRDILSFNLNGTTILGSKNGRQVMEGIPGANISILESLDDYALNEQKKVLAFAYNQIDCELGTNNKAEEKGVDEKMAKEDIGKGPAIDVDKSKDAMSHRPWGEVDKSDLRKKVIEASNYKSIAGDIFLDLREGWEDGVEGALKYPVMCLEGDKAVYNRGGLASAKAYAEQHGDTEVTSKLKKIYEDLDLNDDDEEEKEACKMCDEKSDLYGDCECGTANENKPAEDLEMGDGGEKDGAEPMPSTTNECDPAGDPEGEPKTDPEDDEMCKMKAAIEEMTAHIEELNCKLAESEKACSEYCATIEGLNQEIASKKEEYDALTVKCNEVSEQFDQMKERAEKAEATLCEYAHKEMEAYAESLLNNEQVSDEDRANIISKCQSGQYECQDDIKRDVALAIYNARPAKPFTSGTRFSVPIGIAEQSQNIERKEMTRAERIASRCKK